MLDARSAITAAVRRALADLGVGPEIEPIVERSARPEFGDWSTPVAQRCARVLRRDPTGIAADLRDRVSATPVAGVRE